MTHETRVGRPVDTWILIAVRGSAFELGWVACLPIVPAVWALVRYYSIVTPRSGQVACTSVFSPRWLTFRQWLFLTPMRDAPRREIVVYRWTQAGAVATIVSALASSFWVA